MQSVPPLTVPRSRRARGDARRARTLDRARGRREVHQLFIRYQRDGNVAARDELVRRFLPLAQMLARRYERRNGSFEDIFQVACLALVKAIDRFDATLGNEFSSYAVPSIVGELRRYFRDSSWAVHLPRAMQERALEVTAAIDRLSADLGTSPTPQQIAADLDLTVEAVLETIVAAAGHDTVSLDAPARPEDGDGTTIADAIGAPDEGFELSERRPSVAKALKRLPERERAILYLRFAEDLTQSEIAQRLGISQMHVSRLIRQSLDRLRILVGEA